MRLCPSLCPAAGVCSVSAKSVTSSKHAQTFPPHLVNLLNLNASTTMGDGECMLLKPKAVLQLNFEQPVELSVILLMFADNYNIQGGKLRAFDPSGVRSQCQEGTACVGPLLPHHSSPRGGDAWSLRMQSAAAQCLCC